MNRLSFASSKEEGSRLQPTPSWSVPGVRLLLINRINALRLCIKSVNLRYGLYPPSICPNCDSCSILSGTKTMQIDATFSHVAWLLGKSTTIWLSVWAIRYKADWDYRLSTTAKMTRWGVVLGAYFLAASLPGKELGTARVLIGLLGLAFLCWPNFAYHLTNCFVAWPTTTGNVLSSDDDGSGWLINYTFNLGSERFGNTAHMKRANGVSVSEVYPAAKQVLIRYDPLNPTTQSRILSSRRNSE